MSLAQRVSSGGFNSSDTTTGDTVGWSPASLEGKGPPRTSTPKAKPRSSPKTRNTSTNNSVLNSPSNGGGNSPTAALASFNRTTYNDPTQTAGAQRVANFMYRMWQGERLCDCIIRASGGNLYAHKMALGAYSAALAEKFGDYSSGETIAIDMTDFDQSILRTILVFIYTNDIEITDTNVGQLYSCSFELGINLLVQLCRSHLEKYNTDNAILYYSICENHNLTDLKQRIYAFICDHFKEVSKGKHFVHIPVDRLIQLLSDDSFLIASEIDIFFAIVNWIEFNREERLCHAGRLVRCVRMQLIPPEMLITKLEPVKFIFDLRECHDMLYEAMKFHALKLSGSSIASNYPTQYPRQRRQDNTPPSASTPNRTRNESMDTTTEGYSTPASSLPAKTPQRSLFQQSPQSHASPAWGTGEAVVIVGGVDLQSIDPDIPGKCVHRLDLVTYQWHPCSKLQDYTHHHGVVALQGKLYVIGGAIYDNRRPDKLGSATNMVQRFDSQTGMWTQTAPMIHRRAYLDAVAHGGKIYVVGGEDDGKIRQDSVEVYEPALNHWSYLARMPGGSKIGCAVTAYRNCLFIVGGFTKVTGGAGSVVLGDVECFDLQNQRWMQKRPLAVPRCHANLVVANGNMYLIGGRTKHDDLNQTFQNSTTITSLGTVEIYNEIEDRWNYIGQMKTPRHDAGCTVVGNKIYIAGGMKSPSPYCLSSVECFDTALNLWVDITVNLPYAVAGAGCATVTADAAINHIII